MPLAPAGRVSFSVGGQKGSGAVADIDCCCITGTVLVRDKATLPLTGETQMTCLPPLGGKLTKYELQLFSVQPDLQFCIPNKYEIFLLLQSQAVIFDIFFLCSLPCGGVLTEHKNHELYNSGELLIREFGQENATRFSNEHLQNLIDKGYTDHGALKDATCDRL